MVAAISSINSYSRNVGAEYLLILQELRRLGLTPSGNKEIDKAKLEKAKEELIEKIKHKENEESFSSIGINTIAPVDEVEYTKRAEMEEQRLGAMTVAELNRLYFGI